MRLTVGRTAASDFHIGDDAVSEAHAVLSWVPADAEWTLTDVGSSNGTAVNGRGIRERERGEGAGPRARARSRAPLLRLTSSPHVIADVTTALKDGDIITFGPESHAVVGVERAFDRGATTVEAFLLAEAERCAERVQARAEQLAAGLRDEWRAARKGLLAARPAAG